VHAWFGQGCSDEVFKECGFARWKTPVIGPHPGDNHGRGHADKEYGDCHRPRVPDGQERERRGKSGKKNETYESAACRGRRTEFDLNETTPLVWDEGTDGPRGEAVGAGSTHANVEPSWTDSSDKSTPPRHRRHHPVEDTRFVYRCSQSSRGVRGGDREIQSNFAGLLVVGDLGGEL